MDLHTEQDLEGQPLAPEIPHKQRDVNASYEQEHNEDSRRLTRKQLFYILIVQGLGGAVIDAAANFAIACAMYRTTRKEIRFWPLEKNTIAGDMGLTVIIQGILTTLIASALVREDVRLGRIQPFSFAWPQRRKLMSQDGWRYKFEKAVHFLSPTQTLSFRAGRREFSKSLCMILLRGFIISAVYFLIFWPLAIAITAPLYGGIDMHGTWTPEIIKAVFGGVLGLFMTPLVAALVLGVRSNPTPLRRPGRSMSNVALRCPPTAARIATTTPIAPSVMRQDPGLLPVSVQSSKNLEGGLMRPITAHVSPRS